jgi:hypothetical protein
MFSVHDAIYINVHDAARNSQHLRDVYNVCHPIITRPIPQLDGFCFRTSAEVSYMCDWGTTDYEDFIQDHECNQTRAAS